MIRKGPLMFESNRGHTLIELMIAIIIGLILVLASFQVMAVFEGHKRSTTAINDALQSANYGLYQVDTLVRSAGTGIVQAKQYAYGCALNYTSAGGTLVTDGVPGTTLHTPFDKVLTTPVNLALRLAPAVIFPGATTNGTSDVLLLMSGGRGFGETPVQFTAPVSGSLVQLTHTIGFFANDWVLVSQNAVNPTAAGSCMLTKVDPAYVAETASHSTGNVALPLTDASMGSVTLASFGGNAVITDLGVGAGGSTTSNASFVMYGVDDSDYTLKSIDLLNSDYGAAPQFVGDDVVTMQAVYGINTVGPGALTWVKPIDNGADLYSPASLLDGTDAARQRLRSIKAIRVAFVVRSALPERFTATDQQAIDTSHSINVGSYTLFQTLGAGVQTTWSVPAGQSNYRFRELETTIPLRNAAY